MMKYKLKNKDRVLGILDLDNYTFEADTDINYLPYPLYPAGTTKEYTPTKEDVIAFCKSRVIQEDNEGLSYVLEDLGWNSFAPIKLCQITKCMKLDDFIWITPINDMKSSFENDHMRGSNYKGKLY